MICFPYPTLWGGSRDLDGMLYVEARGIRSVDMLISGSKGRSNSLILCVIPKNTNCETVFYKQIFREKDVAITAYGKCVERVNISAYRS